MSGEHLAGASEPSWLPPLLDRLCCPSCLHDRKQVAALEPRGGALACSRCGAVYVRPRGVLDLRGPAGANSADAEGAGEEVRFYEKVYEAGTYGRDEQAEHVEALAQLLHEVRGDALVLELGTGRGALQDLHPGYLGTDLSVHALGRYLHRPAFASDIQRLPLRPGTVDVAYTVATLEHVPEPERALAEIARVLAPGGLAYLAPAWNCRTWAAEGLHVRPYRDLSPGQRLRKLTIPLRDSLLWRGAFAIPRRAARRGAWLLTRGPTRFRYKRLRANFEVFWAADSDATAQLDPHETALYFESRGWEVCSPRGALRRLFHRAQPLVVRKPG